MRLFVHLRRRFTQATRTEASRELVYWDCQPKPGVWIACRTLDEARQVASQWGYAGILI